MGAFVLLEFGRYPFIASLLIGSSSKNNKEIAHPEWAICF
jgi:hypothetical protein